MKQGKQSITQWAQEIERQAQAKEDYLVSTDHLTMLDSNTLGVEQERFSLQPLAHKQIAQRLDIPTKYYNKLRHEAPDILQINVNHGFHHKPERRMIRTLDGQARAFLSDRYQRIDNNHVVETVVPILSAIPGLDIKSCEVTDSKLYLKVVSTETRLQVDSRRVGDFVESGVLISNSEVGLGSLSIQPFFHFLVCTNGMVRNKDGMRAYHVGAKYQMGANVWEVLSDNTKRLEDAATLSRIQDVLRAAMDKVRFQEAVNAMNAATQREIEGDVPEAINKTAEILKLSQDETSLVMRHLTQGGDISQYGLMNAVTRTAEDIASYDRATEIEAMGGVILDLTPSQWKAISQAQQAA